MESARFQDYLATRYASKGSGKPLTRRAISDCLSRVRRLEKVLGIDVDAVPLDDGGIRELASRLKTGADEHGLSVFAVRDCTAALNRYVEFKSASQPVNTRRVV